MGERLRQLDPRKPGGPITVVLATFHTTLLVLVVLSLIFFRGDLGNTLDGLNTLSGLALFAYLWAITWVTTAAALRRLKWPDRASIGDTVRAAAYWAGVTGVATIVIPIPVAVIGVAAYAAGTADIDLMLFAIFIPAIGAFASPFAFAVGAFLGAWIGLVDHMLLRLSESVLDDVSPAAPDVHF